MTSTCISCDMSLDSKDFFEYHQTMQDSNIWCIKNKKVK